MKTGEEATMGMVERATENVLAGIPPVAGDEQLRALCLVLARDLDQPARGAKVSATRALLEDDGCPARDERDPRGSPRQPPHPPRRAPSAPGCGPRGRAGAVGSAAVRLRSLVERQALAAEQARVVADALREGAVSAVNHLEAGRSAEDDHQRARRIPIIGPMSGGGAIPAAGRA